MTCLAVTELTTIDRLSIFGAEYLYLVMVAGFLCWLVFQSKLRISRIVVLCVIAFPVIYLLRIAAGALHYDPLPLESPAFVRIMDHGPGNGFPSDHTLLCAAIATASFLYDRYFGAILWTATLLVGASRVYAGLHHPIDIAVSAGLAIVVTVAVRYTIMPVVGRSTWFRRRATSAE